MGGDQPLVDIARMRGGVANAVEPGEPGERAHQIAEAPFPVIETLAVIGVDVLPEQGDLPRARCDQFARLVQDLRRRARILGAAGIGHDAERAELVAAFLDGQKRGHPLPCPGRRQMVEFGLLGKAGIDHAAAAAPGPRHQLRQPVVGLRAEDQVDIRAPGGGSRRPRPGRRSRRRRSAWRRRGAPFAASARGSCRVRRTPFPPPFRGYGRC